MEKSKIYINIENCYRNSWTSSGKSFQRLNTALYLTLKAGIMAGMTFNENDFAEIWKNFKGFYWFGNDKENCYGERFYTYAVENRNLSACKSFESWKNREPFKMNERLCESSRFEWKGLQVEVTSFADDGSYLVACHYESFYYGRGGVGKPKKVFKITQDDLKAWRKAKKEVIKFSNQQAA